MRKQKPTTTKKKFTKNIIQYKNDYLRQEEIIDCVRSPWFLLAITEFISKHVFSFYFIIYYYNIFFFGFFSVFLRTHMQCKYSFFVKK